MSALKISIVVPNKNGAPFLRQCLDSIFTQNYPNLEIIVVDGQSEDESQDIINDYSSQIAHKITLKPTGLYPALNAGFAKATGDVFCYLNSDDTYMPGALKSVSEVFTTFPMVHWLTGQPLLQNELGQIVMSHPARRWSRLDYALGDFQFVQQESTFWRASLWKKVEGGFNESLKAAGDLELWSRFFRLEDLYTFNAPLAAFRVSKDNKQLSQASGAYEKESFGVLESYKNALSPDARTRVEKVQWWSKVASMSTLPKFMTDKAQARAKFLRQLPPKIIFDRKLYGFKLSDED